MVDGVDADAGVPRACFILQGVTVESFLSDPIAGKPAGLSCDLFPFFGRKNIFHSYAFAHASEGGFDDPAGIVLPGDASGLYGGGQLLLPGGHIHVEFFPKEGESFGL